MQITPREQHRPVSAALDPDRAAAGGRRPGVAGAERLEAGPRREASPIPFRGGGLAGGLEGQVRGPAARALLALLLLPAPALAQAGCEGAQTQAAMTACAADALAVSDAELNGAYAAAIELAGIARPGKGLDARLRDAQRAWIAFRDAACAAEAAVYEGGSMRPMVEARCLDRLTRARAQDLFAFTDSLGLGTRTP